jgi:hypothetical protein
VKSSSVLYKKVEVATIHFQLSSIKILVVEHRPWDSNDYPFLAQLSSKPGGINMSFNVYKAGYVFGPVRNHYALFVETDDDKKGYFIHVFGDVQEGMEYNIQGQTKPEYREGYLGKELLGTVSWHRFKDLLDVCESMPPPWKQLDELGRKIHPNVAFYRCGEWLEEVIQKLKDDGILKTLMPNSVD